MADDRALDFANLEYVFLDRDGVLNRNLPAGRFVTCCEELELLPGVEEAVAKLNRRGHKVIVVSNQRGIALGLYSEDDLRQMHDRLQADLAEKGGHLDAIYICPHDAGQCNCRKPLTGMFEQAFRDFSGAQSENSVMIGDSLRDMQAGTKLGMRTVLVGNSGESKAESDAATALASVCVGSLAEFVSRYIAPEG